MEEWIQIALASGFTHAKPLDIFTLKPLRQVRDMCAADKCHAYGKNWTCPPNCGTLEECEKEMQGYQNGLLVQTVGKMSGPFDYKTVARTEENHLRYFYIMAELLRDQYSKILCLGAGGCRVCGKCAYPEPCRFPDQACSSMEGYGLMVSFVCRDNKMPYYYGENTLTYTSCYLWSEG